MEFCMSCNVTAASIQCMMSIHTPTHFLFTHLWWSSLAPFLPSFLPSLLPCLLFLPPSISESFPLTKSFFGLSTHSRKTPTVVIYVLCHQYPHMGKYNTWSDSTLLYKMFKTKQRTAAFILFHSILYCKTPSQTHEVVIECHKTCRASCLFALKMSHKVVQLFHWIIDWSVCMQTPTCRSHISESLLTCTSISNCLRCKHTNTKAHLCKRTVICFSFYHDCRLDFIKKFLIYCLLLSHQRSINLKDQRVFNEPTVCPFLSPYFPLRVHA